MCNCMLSLKFLVCSKVRAYSENRNQRMRQVVAFLGGLKTMENLKPSGSESGCGRLYTEEVVVQGSNCKALTGKILVLWIDGRLWETVAYES